MLSIEEINFILVIFLSIVIFICSIGILIATRFQNKQKKKYQECLRLIKEKEDGTLSVKNGLDIEEIKKVDKNIDPNKLMMKLYDTYLELINKLNNNDKDFENILNGFIKEFYENKIDIYNQRGYLEIIDSIELVNYSITEFEKEKLKFRVSITCFNYKKVNDQIISGSNLERVEQIIILTYVKNKKKWLINNIEKVYEKKLSI